MIVFMLYFYEITLFFEWNLRISVYIMLYLMEYLEYDYDNDIMWKPCILILTILPSLEWLPFYGNNHWLNSTSSDHHSSLPWINHHQQLGVLLMLEVPRRLQGFPLDPVPCNLKCWNVSSPDGFSIQSLWTVSKFKFTKYKIFAIFMRLFC